jgi:hypothetical protein
VAFLAFAGMALAVERRQGAEVTPDTVWSHCGPGVFRRSPRRCRGL